MRESIIGSNRSRNLSRQIVIRLLLSTYLLSLAMPETSASLVIATRLHLGHSSSPPTDLPQKIAAFQQFCDSIQAPGVIAVDATPKITEYDLHQAVLEECRKQQSSIHILPVTPWGQFTPALNALVAHAAAQQAHSILFVSAETSAPTEAIDQLLSHIVDQPDVLVAGAVLPGHEYQSQGGVTGQDTSMRCPLNGLTSPWNTLAVWNVQKLSLTGFQMVSEGLLTSPDYSGQQDNIAGIEEVVTIALLQKLFPDSCQCKLVKLDGVSWDLDFDDDKRRAWHEAKMKSKLRRSNAQLTLLGLDGTGTVEHC